MIATATRRVLLVALITIAPFGPSLRAQGHRWCDQLPRPAFRTLTRVPVTDDWYQVYRVTDGVYAIAEPYQWQQAIAYLILGTRQALLFDTGMGISRISTVVRELTHLPVVVLNSHTHFDHIGGNAEFAHILAMDTPFTRRYAASYPAERYRGEVAPEALCRPLPRGVTAATYRIRPYAPERYIHAGERLALGGRTLQVLSVPGHTPDAIALLDEQRGILWTGDTYYNGAVWLFAPETDLDAYEASVARLSALSPRLRLVLGAHNTPIVPPTGLVALGGVVRAMRSGRLAPKDSTDGRLTFTSGDITIITSRAALAGR